MKKAFTLIELMVVICVIAIFVAMMIPALNSAEKKRKQNIQRSKSTQTFPSYNRFNVGDKVEITSLGVDGSIQSIVPNGVSGVNYIVTYKLPNGELKNIEVSEFQIRPK